MIKFIDVSGKTEEEAIRRALEQLSLDRDEVSVEILERAKSGFLVIGGQPALVRVSMLSAALAMFVCGCPGPL